MSCKYGKCTKNGGVYRGTRYDTQVVFFEGSHCDTRAGTFDGIEVILVITATGVLPLLLLLYSCIAGRSLFPPTTQSLIMCSSANPLYFIRQKKTYIEPASISASCVYLQDCRSPNVVVPPFHRPPLDGIPYSNVVVCQRLSLRIEVIPPPRCRDSIFFLSRVLLCLFRQNVILVFFSTLCLTSQNSPFVVIYLRQSARKQP